MCRYRVSPVTPCPAAIPTCTQIGSFSRPPRERVTGKLSGHGLGSRAERIDTHDRGIQGTAGETTDRILPFSRVLGLSEFGPKYFANAFPWLGLVIRQLVLL